MWGSLIAKRCFNFIVVVELSKRYKGKVSAEQQGNKLFYKYISLSFCEHSSLDFFDSFKMLFGEKV